MTKVGWWKNDLISALGSSSSLVILWKILKSYWQAESGAVVEKKKSKPKNFYDGHKL